MLVIGGENLFDMISEVKDGALSYKAVPGGSPYNTAVAAGRLGAQVCYLSPISNDHLGDHLVRYLSDSQVSFLGDRVEAPTSLALVNLSNGQASYQFYRTDTAERLVQLNALKDKCRQAINQEYSMLHIGSLALTGEEDGETWCQVFEWAHSKMLTSVDLNIRPQFIEHEVNYRQRLQRIMNAATVVKLSDEDLAWWLDSNANSEQVKSKKTKELSDAEIELACFKLLESISAKMLLLTQGSYGSRLFVQNQANDFVDSSLRPAFKTESFKDTVGAGDTFMGVFLAKLQELKVTSSHTWTLQELRPALRYASMAATINCERVGCNPPYREMVLQRLSQS